MTPAQRRVVVLLVELGLTPACVERLQRAPCHKPKTSRLHYRERDLLAWRLRFDPPPLGGFSYPEIAEAVGLWSHSSAIEAVRREQARRGAAKAIGWAGSSATFQNAPTPQTGSRAARGQA